MSQVRRHFHTLDLIIPLVRLHLPPFPSRLRISFLPHGVREYSPLLAGSSKGDNSGSLDFRAYNVGADFTYELRDDKFLEAHARGISHGNIEFEPPGD